VTFRFGPIGSADVGKRQCDPRLFDRSNEAKLENSAGFAFRLQTPISVEGRGRIKRPLQSSAIFMALLARLDMLLVRAAAS
jgi:hypothetical protein